MTRADFTYTNNFPSLTDQDIDIAYKTISVMFSGVFHLWSVLPEGIREAKRNLCVSLLVAWYLLDTNPAAAVGVMGNGGMALTSKSIGGTSLSFQDMDSQEGIKQLNSNVFGQKALSMIQSAPERYSLYG